MRRRKSKPACIFMSRMTHNVCLADVETMRKEGEARIPNGLRKLRD